MSAPWEIFFPDSARQLERELNALRKEFAEFKRRTCGECKLWDIVSAPDCPHSWGYDDQSDVPPRDDSPACMAFQPKE